MAGEENQMEKIVSLAKRRGFVFPGSEIYGGLAGTWDYGPLGVELKNNIKNLWWDMFVYKHISKNGDEDMVGIDAAILMNSKVWEASGHVSGFSDPLVDCKKCKSRFRADEIGFRYGGSQNKSKFGLWTFPTNKTCPNCGVKINSSNFTSPLMFKMMFKTYVGPVESEENITYLRPETAGGIFVNYKNIMDSSHRFLPFGIAQIGKAFRNEIAPRDFLFRSREFEQMEIEYFVKEAEWKEHFEKWRKDVWTWIEKIGIDAKKVSELDVPDSERAHYSKETIDFEFEYPFGKKELYGLAYRGDFDLSAHEKASGQGVRYAGEPGEKPFLPHVIEPSFGVDRTVLAILTSAYDEDELGGEKRIVLKLKPQIAPIKVAVFPLLKNKPDLVSKAKTIYTALKKKIHVAWDDNGNIGKRYRRQDEIGTPWCVTVDFDTLGLGENPKWKDTVTVRDRDTGKQERHQISELDKYFEEMLG